MSTHNKHIAVIGAGWAGCAAGVRLTELGYQVSLFEASRHAGGRARRVTALNRQLDNGQHILLGAYRQSLKMMQQVGISVNEAMLRLPLQMIYPEHVDGMEFIAPRLPAPLHLLIALWRAKGLQKEDKLALARFSTTARWMGWRLHQDCTVSELLERFEQTPRLCRLMWHPLCIAALNTDPSRASAQVFLNVLRDSLGAKRSASDMLIPRVNLSALFPEKALSWMQNRGADIHFGAPVKQVEQTANGWHIHQPNAEARSIFDGIVIATDIANARRLLTHIPVTPELPELGTEAICTCYLQYPEHVRLSRPMFALLENKIQGHVGQYVFDRGYLSDDQTGMLAVVISAPEPETISNPEALVKALSGQLAQHFQHEELSRPIAHQIITEKRATFSCTPGLQRPDNDTGIHGLMLAGDYTQGDYPATLEGAVRSGMQAANIIRKQIS